MRSITYGVCVAFAASVVGSFGCGAGGAGESVGETRAAANVDNWSMLRGMGSTGSYTLTADIDAAGRTWTPKDFFGTFDGGNHTIRNLTIDRGSFFSYLTNASVRNIRFVDLKITGGSTVGLGGLVGTAVNSTIENCAVHADILGVSASTVGGIAGTMTGGSITRSYARGTITGNISYAGGLVGIAQRGGVGPVHIYESYAQVTVTPNTASTSTNVIAGGILGYGDAAFIHDVYAVGNVTGRGGSVGGIVGYMHCTPDSTAFQLFKTIYRGDVIDKAWSSRGGWKGPVGGYYGDCFSRFDLNYYDRSLDQSENQAVSPTLMSIRGFTTTELREPRSVIGGVFCQEDVVPGRCGDNTWSSPPWTAGSSTQHHVLMNMPGPNPQPR